MSYFSFWPYPRHVEVQAGDWTHATVQPEAQEWQCQILNPLSHHGTLRSLLWRQKNWKKRKTLIHRFYLNQSGLVYAWILLFWFLSLSLSLSLCVCLSLFLYAIRSSGQDNWLSESEILKHWAETQNRRKEYHGQERMRTRGRNPKREDKRDFAQHAAATVSPLGFLLEPLPITKVVWLLLGVQFIPDPWGWSFSPMGIARG